MIILYIEVFLILIKDNVTISIEWRFGPEWLGQRCSAKTRRETGCLRPANEIMAARLMERLVLRTDARAFRRPTSVMASSQDKLEKRRALFAHNGILI